MKKKEYLQKLREYLSYELPTQLVEKNISFYSGYIDDEVRNGKTIDEVIESLGDPQLIARSIVDAAKSGNDGIPNTADDVDFSREVYGNGRGPEDGIYDSGYDDGGRSQGGYGTAHDGAGNDARRGNGIYVFHGGCFTGIVIMLIVFCFLSMFGWIIGLLSPILMPICIVLLIMWLLSRRE